MKKGLMFFNIGLFLLLALALNSKNSLAYDCTDGFSATECVCGHTPSSILGYGQIIIGATTYSCNNIGDSICPEDFTDGVTQGNCTSCPDNDCSSAGTWADIDNDGILNNNDPDIDGDGTPNGSDPDIDGDGTLNGVDPTPSGNAIGYIKGYVRDSSGVPISGAVVTGRPNQWLPNANLERSATTNVAGYYESPYFITGEYYVSAAKGGYDTQLIRATIIRGQNTTIDFTLQEGTCYSDCTNTQNRCDVKCDGITFADGNSCNFYSGPLAFANEVKLLCNNREKGTLVKLSGGQTASQAYFVECCEGSPEVRYYAKAEVKGNFDNLITQEKITRYNDVPVRVVIKYWD